MASQDPATIKQAIDELVASDCKDASKDIQKAKDLLEYLKHSAGAHDTLLW